MTSTPELAKALVAFQAEMPTVHKGKTADTGKFKYAYADMADIAKEANPVLTKHGLAFSAGSRRCDDGSYEVVGTLLHTSGESREGALPIFGRSPQEIGSSITYNRRYLFGLLTGLVTDADDDGALAQKAATQRPKRQAPARTQDDAPMGEKTRGELFALLSERGITDRDAQLAGIRNVIGRPIESRSEMTEADGRAVIASLRRTA